MLLGERSMSDHHSNHQVVSEHPSPSAQRIGGGDAVAQPARNLTEALLQALEQLEQAQLQTTHRANPDDDDEDPTRRG
jgi:hypothetical protein